MARCLDDHFVGPLTTQTALPDCRLGVHDGPKVAMPGDRLVNGAGVSRRRRGQSTFSDSVAGTDDRGKSNSWRPFVGHLNTTATAGLEYMVRARAGVREVAGPIPAQGHPILGSSANPVAKTFVAAKT